MGIYWSANKVDFGNIKMGDVNPDVIDGYQPFCDQLRRIGEDIKSNTLCSVSSVFESASEYMSDSMKRKIFPFFVNTFWVTYDDEHIDFIDFTHYTPAIFDELGMLEKYKDLYWRSYSWQTLKKILDDFDTINMLEIRLLLVASYYAGSTDDERKELVSVNFQKLMTVLDHILAIYRKCVSQKMDLIIEYE